MKVIKETDEMKNNESIISVKSVIDQLIKVILYSSTKKGIFFINAVSSGFKAKSDVSFLALVLGNLIKDVISFSENDCLRIRSSDNGEIIISSKKSNLTRNRSFMVSVDSLQVIAERLGAFVSISGSFTNGTEIYVRFNKKAA